MKYCVPMEYCTIQDAAEALSVSRPTVYKLIEDGELKRHTSLGRPALNVAQVNQLRAKRDAKTNGSSKSKKAAK